MIHVLEGERRSDGRRAGRVRPKWGRAGCVVRSRASLDRCSGEPPARYRTPVAATKRSKVCGHGFRGLPLLATQVCLRRRSWVTAKPRAAFGVSPGSAFGLGRKDHEPLRDTLDHPRREPPLFPVDNTEPVPPAPSVGASAQWASASTSPSSSRNLTNCCNARKRLEALAGLVSGLEFVHEGLDVLSAEQRDHSPHPRPLQTRRVGLPVGLDCAGRTVGGSLRPFEVSLQGRDVVYACGRDR